MKSTPKQLRIGCWNTRGFKSAIPNLRSLLLDNDIFMINEHWLHSNCLNMLDEVSNDFHYHGRASKHASEDRYGRKRGQGGVAIYWRKQLRGVSPIDNLVHDRVCGIRMENGDGSVLIFLSIYMPASSSDENLQVTIDELAGMCENFEDNSIVIICGDFNGDPGAEGGARHHGPATKAGKIILKFMRDHNLVSVNLSGKASGPIDTYQGHNGSSAIDHIMLPKYLESEVISCCVGRNESLNTSDHLPVEAIIKLDMLPRMVKTTKSKSRLNWDKLDTQEVKDRYQAPLDNSIQGLLAKLRNTRDINENVIDQSFDFLVRSLHQAAREVPKTRYAKHLKPYWCEELERLKKEKMFWFNIWKSEGRTLDDDNWVRKQMKLSKKLFIKRIRNISKEYQNNLVSEAAWKAEYNRDDFWKLIKQSKGGKREGVNAVKNKDGKVVYEITEILDVWKSHFDELSSPKGHNNFNQEHFNMVTETVQELSLRDDNSPFTDIPFSTAEMVKAISKLNCKKAPGHDDVTSEHVKNAGPVFMEILCILYNSCIKLEYIPGNFRKGIQVPLYKGKNTCSLEPDNYRGITLLSTFNKLFEVLIWERLQFWWFDERVTSDLQGASRKGFSCVHTALTLQETISKERERNKRVFVAYYDVSKAFDSVWTDGLFFQLHNLGIRGTLWRLLYKSYQNFTCCVRIADQESSWYNMDCGIHQGGYLSLVKYTAFIDTLIKDLENSNLCSAIYRIPTSPVGYADDLAASTISKNRMDLVMQRVNQHGCDWRYSFNASKSAVLVFGESVHESRIGREYRMFSLGGVRVKERLFYDHVGVKTCVKGDTHVRTEEKVSKARKSLNMTTNIGIRKGGLNMSTCNVIYWSVVIPTLLFGCEVWFIKNKDIELLNGFQRYALLPGEFRDSTLGL